MPTFVSGVPANGSTLSEVFLAINELFFNTDFKPGTLSPTSFSAITEPGDPIASFPIEGTVFGTGFTYEQTSDGPLLRSGVMQTATISVDGAARFLVSGLNLAVSEVLAAADLVENGADPLALERLVFDRDWDLTGATGVVEGVTANQSLPFSDFQIMLPGDDVVRLLDGGDTYTAGAGDDAVYGGGGSDTLSGGDGRDRLFGGDSGDALFGDQGLDTIYGGAGFDLIYGHEGPDKLRGGGDADTLFGGAGGDTIRGDDGDDRLFGKGGRDKLYGGAGDDDLRGGVFDDQLFGGDGVDKLTGSIGDDRASGGKGGDTLSGGDGDDRLGGGKGNDSLNGGRGDDILTGGYGRDVFVFGVQSGADVVLDFKPGVDRIDVSGAGVTSFTDLVLTDGATGALATFGAHSIEFRGVAAADMTADDFGL